MTEPDELQALLDAASPGPWHHVNPSMVSPKTRTVHGTVPAERIDYVSTWPGLGTPPGHRVVISREAGVRTADMALIAQAPALASEVLWLRAAAAASVAIIKALEARVAELEEANAALEDMASRYAIQMSDMLTRLNERYPEDFVWLKEGDQ